MISKLYSFEENSHLMQKDTFASLRTSDNYCSIMQSISTLQHIIHIIRITSRRQPEIKTDIFSSKLAFVILFNFAQFTLNTFPIHTHVQFSKRVSTAPLSNVPTEHKSGGLTLCNMGCSPGI